ncbi:MAG: nickel pincer cofactor biosynthesis protein LarB [Chloroflexi bacterium]|nr:nickel pincer cofactor biosynthesis protein LarB [Chloroflexota bacterium]
MDELEFANPDLFRDDRKGAPEVIFAGTKTVEQCLAIAQKFLQVRGRAILSRVPPDLEARLRAEFPTSPDPEHPQRPWLEWDGEARAAVLRRVGGEVRPSGGRVGIITAGTSDIPVAAEAALICREMGCEVFKAHDVGVAGLHRLFEPLRALLRDARVDVIVVAAGMDGALPSVVAGLVDVPVIGLPTSVGYGFGGGGIGALTSMLQTCAPGLAVVNIDNGVGAGIVAGLIANRVAAARREGDGK